MCQSRRSRHATARPSSSFTYVLSLAPPTSPPTRPLRRDARRAHDEAQRRLLAHQHRLDRQVQDGLAQPAQRIVDAARLGEFAKAEYEAFGALRELLNPRLARVKKQAFERDVDEKVRAAVPQL